jgi:hypothetical protein
MRRALLVALLAASLAHAQDVRKNWFNDPFIQVRNGLPNCPVPLGPLLTEAEMRAESHSRVERGTSCWMAGKCAQPNAYFYDAKIAEALRQRFAQSSDYRDASLWISVKRRFVWIEGCAGEASDAASLEALAQEVPDVEHVFVDVMTGTSGKPPYRLLHPQ